MPGPLTYVDEEITSERQLDLDRYCKELINLPKYLSQSKLVQRQLFGIHEGDIELDYDPRVMVKKGNDTSVLHLSIGMHPTSTSNTITSAHTATTNNPPEPELPENSTSQRMVSSSPLPSQQQQQQIKIKIVHKDDMFAMKVPADCSLDYLRSKVVERIGHPVSMQYKNEASCANEPLEGELDMEEAFVQAIQRGKLTVTALDL